MNELPRLRESERYGACDDADTPAPKVLYAIHATTKSSEITHNQFATPPNQLADSVHSLCVVAKIRDREL